MWLIMPEHNCLVTDASPADQASGLSPAVGVRPVVAVGSFAQRRARYLTLTGFEEAGSGMRRPSNARVTDEELQQAVFMHCHP